VDCVEDEDGVDYVRKMMLRYTRLFLTGIGLNWMVPRKVPGVLIRNSMDHTIIDIRDTALHGVGKIG
jgi:hypothetical protein